jgi:hypothetical protein
VAVSVVFWLDVCGAKMNWPKKHSLKKASEEIPGNSACFRMKIRLGQARSG